jgi:hypothetical protein
MPFRVSDDVDLAIEIGVGEASAFDDAEGSAVGHPGS